MEQMKIERKLNKPPDELVCSYMARGDDVQNIIIMKVKGGATMCAKRY